MSPERPDTTEGHCLHFTHIPLDAPLDPVTQLSPTHQVIFWFDGHYHLLDKVKIEALAKERFEDMEIPLSKDESINPIIAMVEGLPDKFWGSSKLICLTLK